MPWPPPAYVEFIHRYPVCGRWLTSAFPSVSLFHVGLPTALHQDDIWVSGHVTNHPEQWVWYENLRPACACPMLFCSEDRDGRPILGLVGPSHRSRSVGRHFHHRWSYLMLWPGIITALADADAEDLVDRIVDLEPGWGAPGRTLLDEIQAAPVHDHALILSRALHARLETHRTKEHTQIRCALDLGFASGGACATDELAAAMECSSGHAAHLFRRHVGFNPKLWLRTVRFERVRRALALTFAEQREPNWKALAEQCGYCNQPQLVREFRDFIGLPPQAFFDQANHGRLMFGFGVVRRLPAPATPASPIFDPTPARPAPASRFRADTRR